MVITAILLWTSKMSKREIIKKVINEPASLPGKIFALCIQTLIILTLITFSISTLPDIDPRVHSFFHIIELFTIVVFSLEYTMRIIFSENRLRFIFSFFGIVDLLAILPSIISLGIDLRFIRIIRLVRLVRILKLLKYNKALIRFHKALLIAKEEIVLFGFVSLIILYSSAVGIYYCEHGTQPEIFKSVLHSLWWALITLTTVGYGDMVPLTIGGKIFTFFVLMTGLGILAVPTGLIASALSQVRNEETA